MFISNGLRTLPRFGCNVFGCGKDGMDVCWVSPVGCLLGSGLVVARVCGAPIIMWVGVGGVETKLLWVVV